MGEPQAQTDILLLTINARYIHSALGLRSLFANLGELQARARIVELGHETWPIDMAEQILAHAPKIVGLGVYIWNLEQSTVLVELLKQLRPDLKIVLGGPEVSYDAEDLPICQLADVVVSGEGEHVFVDVCKQLLSTGQVVDKWVKAELIDLSTLHLPYAYYSDEDIAHRILYVEASRGCPYRCEFCLSSRDPKIRRFATDVFVEAMQHLLDRGALRFKFIDRCFNLSVGPALLEFFWQRYRPGMFLHFEWVPDQLDATMLELLARFPSGAIQLEAGIQSFDAEVAARIGRHCQAERVCRTIKQVRAKTAAHVHADLIVGLPGEDVHSFAAGLDRLVELGPQEIQIGFLKRLRGTAIGRHDDAWGMVYNSRPPYDVLCTSSIDFATMQSLKRLARFWDLLVNSGHFARSVEPILKSAAFAEFAALSAWLYAQTGRAHSIRLDRLAELLFEYLTAHKHQPKAQVAMAIAEDYRRCGRKVLPAVVRRELEQTARPELQATAQTQANDVPRRQKRHVLE